MKVYDSVRIVRLLTSGRRYDGTMGVRRAPEVGDVGTVVHDYDPQDLRAPLAVKKVDPDGNTIWMADFERDELELVETSA